MTKHHSGASLAALAAMLSQGAHAQAVAAASGTLLNIPIPAVPEPSTAWLLALGFLGLVVLRRTRSGPMQ